MAQGEEPIERAFFQSRELDRVAIEKRLEAPDRN
jgi:hypothetical protein